LPLSLKRAPPRSVAGAPALRYATLARHAERAASAPYAVKSERRATASAPPARVISQLIKPGDAIRHAKEREALMPAPYASAIIMPAATR